MTPSYPIVFYVSGHGFGHACRIIEVIHALFEASPGVAVIVKTSAPRRLFENTLRGAVELVDLECDTGMVQVDSLNLDAAESIRLAKAFQEQLVQKAATEASFLRSRAARAVVGDIPPLAFAAAEAAGLPSMAIGNFTWDWIYEGYADQSPSQLAHSLRESYAKATLVLRLPMSGGFAGLDEITRDIPFIARGSSHDSADIRRGLGLPPESRDRPLVLMSFGRDGVAGLDTSALGELSDYTIATTDLPAHQHSIRPAPGLRYLAEEHLYRSGYRYEDLIRAADVVVAKPGYGIVSDAIANDAALLYTSRGHFVEYEVLVKEMPRYLRSQFIDQKDLLAGNWAPALERLLSLPKPATKPALDGARVAAAEILKMLS
jgi:hypothetical protein